MNARGERVIIFGDSLSHPGSDSGPEITDITTGSNRSSSAPGDLLASLLLEQGATAARVNARVGRSAWNFWSRENTEALLSADRTFRPTKVVVVLGTNDIGLSIAKDAEAMRAIKDAYQKMGAEVWAIGPPVFTSASLNAQAEPVIKMMSSIFGGRFLDGRPLSTTAGRAGDGVHFRPESARQTALMMADALLSKSSPMSPWVGVAAGIAGIGALWALMAYLQRRNKRALSGVVDIVDGKRYAGTHAALVRSGARQRPCKSGLDKHARCWASRGR